jgi:hypothetical protein
MEVSNGKVFVKSPQKLRVDFYPSRTKLIPIVNRGKEYPVPTTHSGKPVNPADVVKLAELAVAYYTDFLKKAEAFFVK